MIRVSIKRRISLFFAAMVVLVTVAYVALLYAISFNLTESIVMDRLISSAEWAELAVYSEDGKLLVDPYIDESTEAFVLIYNANGENVYGRAKDELLNLPLDRDDSFREVVLEGRRYYVYDMMGELWDSDYPDRIWLRTYVPVDSVQTSAYVFLRIGTIMLPLLAALAALCGYQITKHAFQPVSAIESTAREIADSADLSKRIPAMNAAKDELSRLVDTFNQMFQKLETVFESEKQFTSDASHELRTPLAVIMTQAEGLAARYAQSAIHTPEAQENSAAVDVILKKCHAMQTLISELLTISRMDNDRILFSPEDVDLGELADMVAYEMEQTAGQRGITICVKAQAGIVVHVDQTLMMRVFVNLIGNAIAYGKDGGHVWVDVKTESGRVVCVIKDDGIGIASNDLPHIWDRFYREDVSRNSEGLGLGLFMVKWIITRFGGNIQVDSVLDSGSVFTITL